MLYADDFRRIARDSLNGRWTTAVGTGFVAGLFGITYFNNRNIFDFIFRRGEDSGLIRVTYGSLGAILQPYLGLLLFALLWSIICFVVGGAVTLGYARFNMELVAKDRRTVFFSDLFCQFHRIGAGFVMQLLRGLFVFLWSLLLIIPGIIASYSYSMTAFIMVDNPEYGALEAITASKKMMMGNKWRLFCLHFSFIGWNILSVLTCGIGHLWLVPYIEAANAAFYLELIENPNNFYYNEHTRMDYLEDHSTQNNVIK
ncbi:MAG: DUF975 family protein [Anaerolineaceae bacterium]|nr:MAG: DUF975 family protein [Anaerolineaceae bacterium]